MTKHSFAIQTAWGTYFTGMGVQTEEVAMASLMEIAGRKLTGLALALALIALPGLGSDAVAADCRAAAARVVAEVGGQLLSVRESGGECVIVVLVPGNGSERPRKVTMRVAE
jgi:hypothetical protein